MPRNDRSMCAGFALAFAATLACGSDSGSKVMVVTYDDGVPPESAEPAGAAGSASNSSAPTGTDAAGESLDHRLDDSPLAGASAGASAGGSSADAGAPAAGGVPSTGETPATSPFPSGVMRPQVMIVGDSITAGPGCYKKYLLADLNAAGYTNFDFVGEYSDDCGGGVRHSAVSCSTAQQYTEPTFTLGANCNNLGPFPGLASLVDEYRPDLLMIQLGVNDVWNGASIDTILGDYTTLVQQARAQNPSVVVALAQIQQISPTGDSGAVFARAEQLITALPAWAQAQSQEQSPVFVADLWTNSNTAQTLDGVHPDEAGAQRMGENWFNALRNILPPD
jgi:hypothetical protein